MPSQFPCLGIPAGVKIHSAVYATNPKRAGELAGMYLKGRARLREARSWTSMRTPIVPAGSHAFVWTLHVPYRPMWRQNQKAPSPAAEARQAEAIAADIVEQMQAGVAYILGPGTTTRAIAQALTVEKTLVGVDSSAMENSSRRT